MNDKKVSGGALLARLDRLPVWPYPYSILFLTGAGFFFSFFDIVTVGIALPVFTKEFHTTLDTSLWTISSSLLGYIIGSFIDSRISDIFGRRISLYLSLLFFSVGSLLSASSQNIGALIFWRFIIGMGIGAEIANVVTYMSELSPAHKRGFYTAIPISIAFIGFAVVPFVGMLLVPHYSWGWRFLFALGGLGGLLVFWMRRLTPETIRWLIQKGRIEEASETLQAAEALCESRTKKSLPVPKQHVTPSNKAKITERGILRNLLLFALIWLFYYTGNYAWLTLDTKLFINAGFNLSSSLELVSVSSMGFVGGGVLSIYLGDKIERKISSIVLALIWSVLLLLIGWHATKETVMVLGFFTACSISLIIPTLYIYTTEQFPTGIRATCVSITDGIGHLGGAFCGQYTFFFYDLFKSSGYGLQAAFTALAMTGFMVVILLFFGKRMTHIALE